MSFFSKIKNQRFLSASLMVLTLSIGIVIGTVMTTGVQAAKEGQAVAPDATPLIVPAVQTNPTEFARVAREAENSVANISTDYTPKAVSGKRGRPNRDDDEDPTDEDQQMDLFRRFFGGPGGPGGPGGVPRMPKRFGTGSGFVVDKNGYIITNHHVVEKADNIKVKFHNDPKEYKAKLIGFDKEIDLAVIKIDAASPLPALKIANSDGAQVGDWAIAIGSPFGLQATVTVGIISAKGRDNSQVAGAQQFQNFIQTDAAINPGNSGGPLLNIKGEVIGINTAIATESGGSQGVGFALPINTAVKSYNQIIRYGKVTRGSIGISFGRDPKPEQMKALGVSSGVYVTSVEPGGPAEKAGLKEEDVIVALDGKPVTSGDQLVAKVADTPVGSDLKVTVDRAGKKLDFNITVRDRAEVFASNPRIGGDRPEPAKSDSASGAKFGIAIQNIGDGERERMGLSDKRGVQVTRVDPDSFAEEAGLQERDVIVSINRIPIASVDDVKRVQATLKGGDAVAFRVLRPIGVGGRPRWTPFLASGTLPK